MGECGVVYDEAQPGEEEARGCFWGRQYQYLQEQQWQRGRGYQPSRWCDELFRSDAGQWEAL